MPVTICFLDRDTIRSDIDIRSPAVDHEWIEYQSTQPEQVIDRLQGVEIAITNKVPLRADTLQACPELKMIAVAATGVDIIDLQACREHDIIVSNIRDYALASVPEHALTMMLVLRRQLLRYREEVLRGRWQKENRFCFFDEPIHDLNGATLGIIGFGTLGQATARLAARFGANIIYTSRKPKPDAGFGEYVELPALLSRSDVISCHCALTEETRHLLNDDTFAQMQPHTIVINTSRGAIIDEAALARAITNQTIAGAGIDVLPVEPPPEDSPLMNIASQSNVILTPHIAWASQGAMQTLADQLIDNIDHYLGGTPTNRVA